MSVPLDRVCNLQIRAYRSGTLSLECIGERGSIGDERGGVLREPAGA